jgi:uncharacterized protein (TIGR03437 family)
LAPQAIASLYGTNLAAGLATAQTQPLPVSLGGVSVTLTDAGGSVFPSQLFYVSPGQVNWLVPSGAASGAGTVTLTNGNATFTGRALISATAPGLYTANLSGQGPAAAQVTDGKTYTNTFTCTAGACTLTPIDVTAHPYLVLYGTGIRGAALANVAVRIGHTDLAATYAGAQGADPGLDQVNVSLPAALKGSGQLVVVVTVNGQATNMAQLLFQ